MWIIVPIPTSRKSDYTLTYDTENGTVTLEMGKGKKSQKLGDFDKYLLEHDYYLKYLKNDTYGYYFQVYTISENTPVKNGNNNMYYFLDKADLSDTATCATDITNYVDGTNIMNSYYFDMSNHRTYYCYAENCPDHKSFSEPLNYNGSGTDNTNWYFYPWLLKSDDELTMSLDSFARDESKNTCEYVLKDNISGNIYYSLDKDNNMLLFNSDGQLLFTYHGDLAAAYNNLKDNCGFDTEGSGNYNNRIYRRFYKKGAVPKKKITNIEFKDNPEGISKIIFKSEDGKDYITFNYPNTKYPDFTIDRASVTEFSGNFSPKYNYSRTYKKSQTDITDSAVIDEWKNENAVKSKLTSSSEIKKVCYYKQTTTGTGTKKKTTYNYYVYTVTVNTVSTVKKYHFLIPSLP